MKISNVFLQGGRINGISQYRSEHTVMLEGITMGDVLSCEKLVEVFGLKRNRRWEKRLRDLLPKELRGEYDREGFSKKFGDLSQRWALIDFQKSLGIGLISWNIEDFDGYEFASLLLSNVESLR